MTSQAITLLVAGVARVVRVARVAGVARVVGVARVAGVARVVLVVVGVCGFSDCVGHACTDNSGFGYSLSKDSVVFSTEWL